MTSREAGVVTFTDSTGPTKAEACTMAGRPTASEGPAREIWCGLL
jgi:hypothetical protein